MESRSGFGALVTVSFYFQLIFTALERNHMFNDNESLERRAGVPTLEGDLDYRNPLHL